MDNTTQEMDTDIAIQDDDLSSLGKLTESYLQLKQKICRTHEVIKQYNDKLKECERLKNELNTVTKQAKSATFNYNTTLAKLLKLEMQNNEHQKNNEALSTMVKDFDVKKAADEQHIQQLTFKIRQLEEKHAETLMEYELEKSSLHARVKELEQELKSTKKSYDTKMKKMEKGMAISVKLEKDIPEIKCTTDTAVNTVSFDELFRIRCNTAEKSIMTDETSKIKDDMYSIYCGKCETRISPPPLDKICNIMRDQCPEAIKRIRTPSPRQTSSPLPNMHDNSIDECMSEVVSELCLPGHKSVSQNNVHPKQPIPPPSPIISHPPPCCEKLVPISGEIPRGLNFEEQDKARDMGCLSSQSNHSQSQSRHCMTTEILSSSVSVIESWDKRLNSLETKLKKQLKKQRQIMKSNCWQHKHPTHCCAPEVRSSDSSNVAVDLMTKMLEFYDRTKQRELDFCNKRKIPRLDQHRSRKRKRQRSVAEDKWNIESISHGTNQNSKKNMSKKQKLLHITVSQESNNLTENLESFEDESLDDRLIGESDDQSINTIHPVKKASETITTNIDSALPSDCPEFPKPVETKKNTDTCLNFGRGMESTEAEERRLPEEICIPEEEIVSQENIVSREESRHQDEIVLLEENRHQDEIVPHEENRHQDEIVPHEENRHQDEIVPHEENRHENVIVPHEEIRHQDEIVPHEEIRHQDETVSHEEIGHQDEIMPHEESRQQEERMSEDESMFQAKDVVEEENMQEEECMQQDENVSEEQNPSQSEENLPEEECLLQNERLPAEVTEPNDKSTELEEPVLNERTHTVLESKSDDNDSSESWEAPTIVSPLVVKRKRGRPPSKNIANRQKLLKNIKNLKKPGNITPISNPVLKNPIIVLHRTENSQPSETEPLSNGIETPESGITEDDYRPMKRLRIAHVPKTPLVQNSSLVKDSVSVKENSLENCKDIERRDVSELSVTCSPIEQTENSVAAEKNVLHHSQEFNKQSVTNPLRIGIVTRSNSSTTNTKPVSDSNTIELETTNTHGRILQSAECLNRLRAVRPVRSLANGIRQNKLSFPRPVRAKDNLTDSQNSIGNNNAILREIQSYYLSRRPTREDIAGNVTSSIRDSPESPDIDSSVSMVKNNPASSFNGSRASPIKDSPASPDNSELGASFSNSPISPFKINPVPAIRLGQKSSSGNSFGFGKSRFIQFQKSRTSPDKDSPDSPDKDSSSSPGKDSLASSSKDSLDSPVKDSPDSPVKDSPDSPIKDSPDSPIKDSPDSPVQDTPDSPTTDTLESPVKDSPDNRTEKSPTSPTENDSSLRSNDLPYFPTEDTTKLEIKSSPESTIDDGQYSPTEKDREYSAKNRLNTIQNKLNSLFNGSTDSPKPHSAGPLFKNSPIWSNNDNQEFSIDNKPNLESEDPPGSPTSSHEVLSIDGSVALSLEDSLGSPIKADTLNKDVMDSEAEEACTDESSNFNDSRNIASGRNEILNKNARTVGRPRKQFIKKKKGKKMKENIKEETRDNISIKKTYSGLITPQRLLLEHVDDNGNLTNTKTKRQKNNPKIMKLNLLIDKFVKSELLQLMENTWDMTTHTTVLRKLTTMGSSRVIAKGIISHLSLSIEDNTLLDKTYTPPAPIMPKSHQRISALLVDLQENFPTIMDEVQTGIQFQLFSPSIALPKNAIESLARMYTVLARIQKDREKLRIFCCDAVYFLGLTAVTVLYTVLTCWPEVFPNRNNTNEPLPRCIAHIIMTREHSAKYPKANALKKLLKAYYQYPYDSQATELLQEMTEKLKAGNLDNVLEATMILFAKKHNTTWTDKNVIRGVLVPLIVSNQHPDPYKLFGLLGNIMRPFSIEDKDGAVDKIVVQLRELIQSGQLESADQEEGVISALLSLARQKFDNVVEFILNWTPKQPLRPRTIQQITGFLKLRPMRYWRMYLSRHKNIQSDT